MNGALHSLPLRRHSNFLLTSEDTFSTNMDDRTSYRRHRQSGALLAHVMYGTLPWIPFNLHKLNRNSKLKLKGCSKLGNHYMGTTLSEPAAKNIKATRKMAHGCSGTELRKRINKTGYDIRLILYSHKQGLCMDVLKDPNNDDNTADPIRIYEFAKKTTKNGFGILLVKERYNTQSSWHSGVNL